MNLMSAKKVLIISRKDERETHDTQESLVREFKNTHSSYIEYSGCNFEDILFDYDGNELRVYDTNNNADLREYDLIFMVGWHKTKTLEDAASSVARYTHHLKIPTFNSEALSSRVRGKITQYVTAALHDIPITPFRYSINQEVLLTSLKDNPFAGKFVVKGVAASRGEDNYLIESAEAFEHILHDRTDPKLYFIAQGYVPNDGDYRIIVVGKDVRMVIHRQATSDSHLNNTSKGGVAQLVSVSELPPMMISDSLKLAKLVNREISGVDMVVHSATGKYYLLEVNNMPQLSTGAYVAEKIDMLDSFFVDTLQQ